jgi:hypothetical protein
MFDSSENPCLGSSFFYGIGSGFTVGAAFNMATSRSPMKVGFLTYIIVTLGCL